MTKVFETAKVLIAGLTPLNFKGLIADLKAIGK